MTSPGNTNGTTNPGIRAELNTALQWIAECQAELHRELARLNRVQSALLMVLRSRTEEPETASGGNGDAASSAGESAGPVPTEDPYYFDFSGVDLSGCRTNRARILRLAEASGGTIRLLDAVKAVYAAGRWRGKSQHLRTNLGRLLTEMGERIDRGVYRVL